MKSKLITVVQTLPPRIAYLSFSVLLLVYYLAIKENMIIGFNEENSKGFIVLVILLLFALQVFLLNRYLKRILQSAMIYLYIHFLVVALLGVLKGKSIFEVETATILSLVFLFLMATGLSYLFYMLIEHTRLKR